MEKKAVSIGDGTGAGEGTRNSSKIEALEIGRGRKK